MAKFNEILVGRYNRALQKLLGMKGEPPAPQLASEIAATLSFFYGAEMRFIESWNIYGINAEASAAVGNSSGVRLRNPAASNVIAVIQRLSITGAAADKPGLQLGQAVADLATVSGGGGSFDSRN